MTAMRSVVFEESVADVGKPHGWSAITVLRT